MTTMDQMIDKLSIFGEISVNLKNVIKSYYVFDDNKGLNVLFITSDDKVFAFGSNRWGVCGVGHEMVVNEPKVITELCDKCVQQFYNGQSFALALTRDNKIYVWGNNQFGQLGRGFTAIEKVFKPQVIKGLEDKEIIQISCGSAHTLVLTSDGIVYGFGDNTYGQIGCGNGFGDKVCVITQVKALPKVKSIHCSFRTSFAITDNGFVYSWGRNSWCVLGHELERNECVFEPKLIQNLQNIQSICSSHQNTYFLSNNQNIYFCGKYYENNIECFQLIPKLLKTDSHFQSLNSINCYRKLYPIGCVLSEGLVYSLKWNSIEKTNYKTLEEFYSNECQMTYKTYHLKLQTELNERNFYINGNYLSFLLIY